MSGSPSRRHSTPKPNLAEDTDHLAREEMSGQGSVGGRFVPGISVSSGDGRSGWLA